MAITNAQIAALPTYTSAEQLKMWQKASIDLAAAGVSYAIAGRQLTRSDAEEVRNMLLFWQSQVNAQTAAADGGGIALAQFGEAQ
jgi:hypothetical protein